MLSNIKAWLGVAVAALIAGLFALLQIKSAHLDKAESDVDHLNKINERNAEIKKIDDEIQQSDDEINAASNNDIVSELHKYDRNRKDSD